MSETKEEVLLIFDPVTREEAWRRHTQQKIRYAAWRITRTTPESHVDRRYVDKSVAMTSFRDAMKWAKDWDDGKAIPDGLAEAVQLILDKIHPAQRAIAEDGTRWKFAGPVEEVKAPPPDKRTSKALAVLVKAFLKQ